MRRRTELAIELSSAVRGGLSETEPRHPALAGLQQQQLAFDTVWISYACVFSPSGETATFSYSHNIKLWAVSPFWFGFALPFAVYRFLGSGASPYLVVGLSHAPFICQISPLSSLLNLPQIRFFTFQSFCFIMAIAPVVAVSSKSFHTPPIVLQSSFWSVFTFYLCRKFCSFLKLNQNVVILKVWGYNR